MDKTTIKKTSPDEFFIVQKGDVVGIEALAILLEQMRAMTMLSMQIEDGFCKEVIDSMMLSIAIQGQKICQAIEEQENKS